MPGEPSYYTSNHRLPALPRTQPRTAWADIKASDTKPLLRVEDWSDQKAVLDTLLHRLDHTGAAVWARYDVINNDHRAAIVRL